MDREWADDLAVFCLVTGQPASEYPNLTRLQRQAFMTKAEQIARRRR